MTRLFWQTIIFFFLSHNVLHVAGNSGASALSTAAQIHKKPRTLSRNTTVVNVTSPLESDVPAWKRELPPDLQKKKHTLKRVVIPGANGCRVEIYLLGTAHVSIDSSKDVRLLLEAVEPSVLFLELCDQRIPMMLTMPPSTPEESSAEDVEEKKGFFQKFRKQRRQKKQRRTG